MALTERSESEEIWKEEEGRTEMIHIRAQRMPASSPVVLDQDVELEKRAPESGS